MIGRPVVGVLAVQGAFVEHEAALEQAGALGRQVRTPEELHGIEGLVIPGGESTTFGLVAERSGLLTALREVVDSGLPVFGTCAGMIMLARATTSGAQPLVGGLDIVVRRNAFGRQVRSFECDLSMPVLGEPPVPAVFIRAPWIEEAGSGVDILASVEGHGVAAECGPVLVTAFHPELTDDVRLHERFVAKVRAWRASSEAVPTERGTGVRAQ
jgi:pyridoxal 5'-phosphate synthase pdxT subunit